MLGLAAALAPALFIFGCAGGARNDAAEEGEGSSSVANAQEPAEPGVVMILGTSLTAGYGLDVEQAYPAHLQARVDSAGLRWDVVNAGLSGETSAGARGRIRWLLEQPFDVLVLETGANDMLRGADLDSLRANLEGVIDTVRLARPEVRIVLVGMQAPPNLGEDYGRGFRAIFPEVAREKGLTLVPFLLEGVGGVDSLNQEDAIHPNEEGQKVLAETVWRTLEPVLREEDRRRAGR